MIYVLSFYVLSNTKIVLKFNLAMPSKSSFNFIETEEDFTWQYLQTRCFNDESHFLLSRYCALAQFRPDFINIKLEYSLS